MKADLYFFIFFLKIFCKSNSNLCILYPCVNSAHYFLCYTINTDTLSTVKILLMSATIISLIWMNEWGVWIVCAVMIMVAITYFYSKWNSTQVCNTVYLWRVLWVVQSANRRLLKCLWNLQHRSVEVLAYIHHKQLSLIIGFKESYCL